MTSIVIEGGYVKDGQACQFYYHGHSTHQPGDMAFATEKAGAKAWVPQSATVTDDKNAEAKATGGWNNPGDDFDMKVVNGVVTATSPKLGTQTITTSKLELQATAAA
jgi:hypothetical protein